jgi:hypothetical protein
MAVNASRLAVCLVVLVSTYAIVALSPVPRTLGRNHPERASWFYPIWFNFSATYDDGAVLDYRIGMSRAELLKRMSSAAPDSIEIVSPCGNHQPELRLVPQTQAIPQAIASAPMICAWIPQRRVSLIFTIEKELVRSIRMIFVRNEVI